MAYLLAVGIRLVRWHRLLAACDGDREQALGVLREVERAERHGVRRAPLQSRSLIFDEEGAP